MEISSSLFHMLIILAWFMHLLAKLLGYSIHEMLPPLSYQIMKCVIKQETASKGSVYKGLVTP